MCLLIFGRYSTEQIGVLYGDTNLLRSITIIYDFSGLQDISKNGLRIKDNHETCRNEELLLWLALVDWWDSTGKYLYEVPSRCHHA
jgi:hypothetical protein